MAPTVGRIVHVHGLIAGNTSGSDVTAAIVTRVHSQVIEGKWCVNVKLITDGYAQMTDWLTSIYLYVDETTAQSDPSHPMYSTGVRPPYAVRPPRD